MKELTAYDRFLERQRIAEEQHMNTYPFAGEIKMTKVIKDEQEVIEWEQVDMSKREWVGLTDEEREFLLHQALRFYDTNAQLLSFIKTVEEKLKDKNT